MYMEWKRNGIILGITVGVICIYYFWLPAGIPFLFAWFLAEELDTIVRWLRKHTGISRNILSGVLIALIFGLLGVLICLGIREGMHQLLKFGGNFGEIYKSLWKECLSWAGKMGISESLIEGILEKGRIKFLEYMVSVGEEGFLTRIVSGLKNTTAVLGGVFFSYILSILLAGDLENIRKKVREYKWLEGILRILRRLKKTTVVYFKAQCILMLLVSGICMLGFWIMGNEYFLLLGILLGLLDMIPFLGTGIFLYPAAVIYFFKGEIMPAIICIGIDVVTSMVRHLGEPRLLGGQLGISPLWIVISIYIGLLVFGVGGVFVGPLAFSTIYEAGKEWDVWD